ncbi:MAG: dephospho-CoA kinase [Sulfuriferula sp.]
MTYLVGLTGGIGCGKTTISRLFAELGACVIDTDDISHAITAPKGIANETIKQAFGAEFIDSNGAMHRAKMRELVFSDPDAKRKLESILHPLIYQQVIDKISQLSHAPYILLVVPLLIESPRYLALVQRVVVVDCDEAQQVSRTMARSHLSADAIEKIMASQISRTERLQHADDVISNQNELIMTKAQVSNLHARYLGMRN